MQHLVFVIHEKYITYRMNGQNGSHPLCGDCAMAVIDYLKRLITHKTCEIINHN